MHTLIYGGTFDPIHHGHLITCLRAREILQADKVLFIPAHISPHKTHRRTSVSAEHRLAMLHLALADHAFFLADARELDRGEQTGEPSYTIETIESLRTENPADRFTLLLGADQLPKLHTWHRIGELVDMVQIAILNRPHSAQFARESAPKPPQNAPKSAQNAPESVQNTLSHPSLNPTLPPDALESGQKTVAETLGPLVANRLKTLHTPLIEISSTDIRERIRENLPLDFLLPLSVIAYIQQHNLYRTD